MKNGEALTNQQQKKPRTPLRLRKQAGKQHDWSSKRAGVREGGSYSCTCGTQQGRKTPNTFSFCWCFPLVEPSQREGNPGATLICRDSPLGHRAGQRTQNDLVNGVEGRRKISPLIFHFSQSLMRMFLSKTLPSISYLSHSKLQVQEFRQGQFQNLFSSNPELSQ